MDMFKVPRPPFQIGNPTSQRLYAAPVDVGNRRSSNSSDEPQPLLKQSQSIGSEVLKTIRPIPSINAEDAIRSITATLSKSRTDTRDHLDPSFRKRKRKRDSRKLAEQLDLSRSKKRKRLNRSGLGAGVKEIVIKSPSYESKPKGHEMRKLLHSDLSSLSKQLRREERRRRKQERAARKEEKKKRKRKGKRSKENVLSRPVDPSQAPTSMDLLSNMPLSNVVEGLVEAHTESHSDVHASQAIPLIQPDERNTEESRHKSLSKGSIEEDRPAFSSTNVLRRGLADIPDSPVQEERPSMSSETKARTERRRGSAFSVSGFSTAKRRRGKPVSSEKIFDSSAEEEDHQCTEEEWTPDSNRPKAKDFEQSASQQEPAGEDDPDSGSVSLLEINEAKGGVAKRNRAPQRMFTPEEDKRLRQIVDQYKTREGISDKEFAERLKTKETCRDFCEDLRLERWENRVPFTLLRRARRLYPSQGNSRAVNKGPYTHDEDAIVDYNINKLSQDEFAELLRMDTELHHASRETRELCKTIAAKLPGRTVLSVTRHLVNQYCGEKSTMYWTPSDDLTLKKLVAQLGNRWNVIAGRMGRAPDFCRLRYRDYVSLGKDRKLGQWESDETKKLYDTVMLQLKDTEWEEGEGLNVDVVSRHVNWGTISKKVGERSRPQCRAKWKQLIDKGLLVEYMDL